MHMDVAVISIPTTRTRYLDGRRGGRGRTAPFSRQRQKKYAGKPPDRNAGDGVTSVGDFRPKRPPLPLSCSDTPRTSDKLPPTPYLAEHVCVITLHATVCFFPVLPLIFGLGQG